MSKKDSTKKLKKYYPIFVILFIIALGIIVFKSYNYYLTKTNTQKFTDYLMANGYEKEKGNLFIKNTDDASYYLLKNEIMISKLFSFDDGNINYNYSIDPYKDTIELTLELKGTYDNVYGLSEQKMIYDRKTKNYECEIISNKNFPPMCKEMKDELNIYNDEVKNLVKNSGVNEKYILNKF